MNTIAYFHSTATGSSQPKITGICQAALSRGWAVLRFDLKSPAQVRATLSQHHPTGCVVEAGAIESGIAISIFKNTPVVFFDCNPRWHKMKINCLVQDPEAIGRIAAEELASLKLASYGFVSWPQKSFWSESRRIAFRKCMSTLGLKVYEFRSLDGKGDIDALQSNLAEWLNQLPKPTGIFTATDSMSVQTLNAACRHGFNVPKDVAIIGVDNEDFICDNTRPTLSSIALDFEAAGHKCIEILERQINHPTSAAIKAEFPMPSIVRRTSTRRSDRHDYTVSKALDKIRLQATSGIKAEDILSEFDCSRRMAELRFKHIVGRSILAEIHSVQIETAKKLLRNHCKKIEHIVQSCGYSSVPHFEKIFKRETGRTMREYRLEAECV